MSTPILSRQHNTGSLPFTLPALPAARVLHQIRTIPEVNRSDIRDTLGYSQPSVTRHVSSLIDAGLVEQISPDRAGIHAGRPRTILDLDGRHLVFWGIHLGVRSTVLVISDGAGRIIREQTLALVVQDISATEALDTAARALLALGRGLPSPTGVGAAFSTHIDEHGLINSDIYRWQNVAPGPILAAALGHPVEVATGVTAMAATELLSHPLSDPNSTVAEGSTLYFYAREVIAHSWMFHGAVHRPHKGRSPYSFQDIATSGLFPPAKAPALRHVHPLSNTSVLLAAQAQGIAAQDFGHLVHIAEQTPLAREILDERARLLGKVITLAVDVVDPDALVFAGEAFTLDPRGLQLISSMIREQHGGPGSLRIQRADRNILHNAARQVALHGLWRDPLGTLSS